MPRYQCENGHRGPARDLVLKDAILHTDGTVKVCPNCGASVVEMPCNKHVGRKFNQRNDSGGVLRKPFSIGGIGVR